MTLKHNGIKYPRMTEMLSEADGSAQHGLMPWVGKCAAKYMFEKIMEPSFPGEIKYLDPIIQEAATHYKTVSQEALDVGSEVHRLIEEFLNEQTRN